MKLYSILLISFLSFQVVHGQVKTNAMYLELGGNGGIYTINYDRLISIGEKSKFAPRLGLSWLGKNRFIIPTEVNFLLRKTAVSKNFAELGMGATLVTKKGRHAEGFVIITDSQTLSNKGPSVIYTLRAGYRHQKPEGGFMYRLGLTLLADRNAATQKVLPFGGISIGHSF